MAGSRRGVVSACMQTSSRCRLVVQLQSLPVISMLHKSTLILSYVVYTNVAETSARRGELVVSSPVEKSAPKG